MLFWDLVPVNHEALAAKQLIENNLNMSAHEVIQFKWQNKHKLENRILSFIRGNFDLGIEAGWTEELGGCNVEEAWSFLFHILSKGLRAPDLSR